MRLFEIHDAIRRALETEDGEINSDMEVDLDLVMLAAEDKLEALAVVCKEKKAEAELLRSEAKKLTERAKTAELAEERIEGYIRGLLQALKLNSFKGRLHGVRIQKNGQPSIRLKEGCQIPPGYQRITVELDGKLAHAAWKAGELPESLVATVGDHVRLI